MGASNRRPVFWKFLQVLTVVVAFAAGSGSYSLWMHYAATRSKTSDAAIGRTIPLNTHGTVVFLTQDERHRLSTLGYAAALSLLSSALIYVFRKPFGDG
jgi:hypothetical protein